MGSSHSIYIKVKCKINTKMTSRETFVLNDVQHVPEIHSNQVSISLLRKARMKVLFESDKFVLSKSGMFIC